MQLKFRNGIVFGFAALVSKINVTTIFNMFRINHFQPHPTVYMHFKTNRPQLLYVSNTGCDIVIEIHQRVVWQPKEHNIIRKINGTQHSVCDCTCEVREVRNKSSRIRMRNDYPRLVIKPGETAIKRIGFIACTFRGENLQGCV